MAIESVDEHDPTHMLSLAASLIEAGNPSWNMPPWRWSLEMHCELTEPIDFELASRLVATDPRVLVDRDRDSIRCEHCDHSISGYVAAVSMADVWRRLDRGDLKVGGTLPDTCPHLKKVLDVLIADGNYVTSDPPFRRIGVVLQCEVGDSVDADLVLRSLSEWSRVIAVADDDEVYCWECKASIVGPRFPWDRVPHVEVDFSKMTCIGPAAKEVSRRRWWQRRPPIAFRRWRVPGTSQP